MDFSKNFKNRSLIERKNESNILYTKYPNKIPIIVDSTFKINKHKYLVPNDITIAQLIYIIRKNIKLQPEKALFIFIDNKLPASTTILSSIKKNEDGFLYITISEESVFGFSVF